MPSREAGRIRARVMDFGLARVSTKTRITQTGVLVGTMCYLASEQITGGTIDGRTDMYALGTVLYECLVGKPPFPGEVQSVLYRIVHEQPQPPSALGANIPDDLEQELISMLAKEPSDRPETAGKVADALRRCRKSLADSEANRSVVVSSTGQVARLALAPFVGRKKEIGELQQRMNAAVAGECQLVLVGGELLVIPEATGRNG